MNHRAIIILSIALLLSITLAVKFGQVDLFPISQDSWPLLRDFRIPRVLFAAINGAMLSLAGVLYQLSLRNPLADGFTTGAAASAALGGSIGLLFLPSRLLASLSSILFAFIGMLIVTRVSFSRESSNKTIIILCGIALSVLASSGISFLKFYFDESVNTIIFWLMGGLGEASYFNCVLLFSVLIFIELFLLIKHRQLAILFLDDLSAASTGVNVHHYRKILFSLTTILVGLSVSFCGVIGFLGLMVPHATRAIFGHKIKNQLACAPLFGASALVLFDLISRTILPDGGEVPVGIITSAAGGIFFLLLLTRKGTNVWSN